MPQSRRFGSSESVHGGLKKENVEKRETTSARILLAL